MHRMQLLAAAALFAVCAGTVPAFAQESDPDTYALPAGDALVAAPAAWEASAAQCVTGVWDTIVAIETEGRDLFALNAADGKELWRKPAFYPPEKALTHLPATDGKRVWLGLTDTLYGVSARDGKVLFEAPLDGEIEEDLAYVNGHVIALVSRIEGESGSRERQYFIRDLDGTSGKIKASFNVGKATQALFAVDREAMVAYVLLRKVDATPTDRFAASSYQIPGGQKIASGSTGDVNGSPYAAVSRLAIAGPDGASVYLKDALAKPLNRFGRDAGKPAVDVVINGKKAIFLQGDRVTAGDVSSPSVFWQFTVDGIAPGEVPYLSNSLFTTVGLRQVFPATTGAGPLFIAFDSANGKNLRASKGIEGIASTTYFKNLLVVATGKKIIAVNLDKLVPLARADAPKPAAKPADDEPKKGADAKKDDGGKPGDKPGEKPGTKKDEKKKDEDE